MKIAFKEAKETKYWLLLCKHLPEYPNPEKLIDKIDSIIKIISSIILSSKAKSKKLRIKDGDIR